ncbi:MAG: hypothetical protein M1358_21315, partial [Chloroflexi bacterium]|nr:hypothetical protein [Chloroflexota bacterium]
MTTSTTTSILDALNLLMEPGSVAELRILNTKQATISGYFSEFSKLAHAATQYDGKAPAIYVTLNPVNRSLLARAANRMGSYAKHTTSDGDIVKRRWLPLDFDPVRPAGVSSTEAEHQAALDRARQVREWLRLQGWPLPIYSDSGNGAHILYRIDLPNDAESTELVRRCLEALAFQFSDDGVHVDVKTFNAARIWKLYGTLSAKGDNLPERPHRRSRILEAPSSMQTVSADLLTALAARLPEAPRHQVKQSATFNLEDWIADHKLPVVSSGSWNGGIKYILNPCPWDDSHNNRAAYIVQFASGAIGAGCHHNGCAGKGWAELRTLYEPSYTVRAEDATTSGKQKQEPAFKLWGHDDLLKAEFPEQRWIVHNLIPEGSLVLLG